MFLTFHGRTVQDAVNSMGGANAQWIARHANSDAAGRAHGFEYAADQPLGARRSERQVSSAGRQAGRLTAPLRNYRVRTAQNLATISIPGLTQPPPRTARCLVMTNHTNRGARPVQGFEAQGLYLPEFEHTTRAASGLSRKSKASRHMRWSATRWKSLKTWNTRGGRRLRGRQWGRLRHSDRHAG